MNTILHSRKDHGTIAVHPEKATGFRILRCQEIDPNNNALLFLLRNKVRTCNTYEVRQKANRRIRKTSSSSKKLTLKLFGQTPQLPQQILLPGGAPLRLRLPNICVASNAKKLFLKTTNAVTKKHKLRRIIKGWSQLRRMRSINGIITRRPLEEKKARI